MLHADGREVLWVRSMYSSFPDFSLVHTKSSLSCAALLPALLQKGTGRTRSKNQDTSHSQSLPQDLSLNTSTKQPLDMPHRAMFVIHLKAVKFFLLLDPHHHINIAVVHQCWATNPCQGLSEEVCSCQKENMDNLFAVVRLFFFLQR